MPDLARLTPCWPGNWVVEGMEMLRFKAREPPNPQSCSIRPWGAWGRGCRDPTETPNRHCGQGIYLSYMCLSRSRL